MKNNDELLVLIANSLQDISYFNNYDFSENQYVRMSEIIFKSIEKNKNKEKIINDFFQKLESGKLGMFYKAPISILSIWQDFLRKYQFDTNLEIEINEKYPTYKGFPKNPTENDCFWYKNNEDGGLLQGKCTEIEYLSKKVNESGGKFIFIRMIK